MQRLDNCLNTIKPSALQLSANGSGFAPWEGRVIVKWLFSALASVGVMLVGPVALSAAASASFLAIQILLGLGHLWFANFHGLSL